MRIDKTLAAELGISRSRLQQLIKQGLVRNDRGPIDSKYRPKAGETLWVQIPKEEPTPMQPCERALDILYEDACMLVLNKSAGDIVHPGAGKREGTLAHALLHHCKGKLSHIGGADRPGIVHRLDQHTSGLLVVAKTDAAHEALARQFADRKTLKLYLAYVVGAPAQPQGKWNWPVGRHPKHRQKMCAFDPPAPPHAREACTSFKVIQRWPLDSPAKISLLELRLHTGRTHQIRVHAAKAGCPVVGDSVYGKTPAWLKSAGVTRQLLHAWKLGLHHPSTHQWMEWTAPLPDDFNHFETWLAQMQFSI